MKAWELVWGKIMFSQNGANYYSCIWCQSANTRPLVNNNLLSNPKRERDDHVTPGRAGTRKPSQASEEVLTQNFQQILICGGPVSAAGVFLSAARDWDLPLCVTPNSLSGGFPIGSESGLMRYRVGFKRLLEEDKTVCCLLHSGRTDRHTDTRTHAHTDTRTHGHTHTRTHRHTDTRTHAHTDTRTHAHTDAWERHFTQLVYFTSAAPGMVCVLCVFKSCVGGPGLSALTALGCN